MWYMNNYLDNAKIRKHASKFCMFVNRWCHFHKVQWEGQYEHFWLYLAFNEIRSWECKSIFITCIFYFQNYDLLVLETKPDRAVSIIECDMNVSIPTLIYTLYFC